VIDFVSGSAKALNQIAKNFTRKLQKITHVRKTRGLNVLFLTSSVFLLACCVAFQQLSPFITIEENLDLNLIQIQKWSFSICSNLTACGTSPGEGYSVCTSRIAKQNPAFAPLRPPILGGT
jgi:hypothetical protein